MQRLLVTRYFFSWLLRPHNVPSSSLRLIQLHWMPWYRRGRGFVRTSSPRLLCFREFWNKSLHGRFPSGGISSISGSGFVLSPPSGDVETVGEAPEGAQLIASGLSTEFVETVLQSRAPSTRKLSLKWIVHFMGWKLPAAPS